MFHTMWVRFLQWLMKPATESVGFSHFAEHTLPEV